MNGVRFFGHQILPSLYLATIQFVNSPHNVALSRLRFYLFIATLVFAGSSGCCRLQRYPVNQSCGFYFLFADMIWRTGGLVHDFEHVDFLHLGIPREREKHVVRGIPIEFL
jgi:hypothetical protein